MRKSCDVEQLEVLENVIVGEQDWRGYVRGLDDAYVLCGIIVVI